MTPSGRISVARLALIACFSIGLFSVGCAESTPKGSVDTIAFDPVKSKSQEDGMRKAAEDAAKARK
jgi:hypothetical protein